MSLEIGELASLVLAARVRARIFPIAECQDSQDNAQECMSGME